MVWRGGYHGEGMGDEMVIIIIELATSVRIAVIARLVLTVTPAEGWQNHPSSPLVHLHRGEMKHSSSTMVTVWFGMKKGEDDGV